MTDQKTCQKTVSLKSAQLLDDFFNQRLEQGLDRFMVRAWEPDEAALEEAYAEVMRTHRLRGALASLSKTAAEAKHLPLYLTTAVFLQELFYRLTKTRDEDLVYITGPEDGNNIFSLTRVVDFDLAEKSPGGACPEANSQLKALKGLDQNGQRLLATFHSHPGYGVGGTTPSSVDLKTQERLEKLGYPSIGGIFSRDGFARFYAKEKAFQVMVTGKGCEQIEEDIFRLNNLRPKTLFFRRQG